MSEPSGSNATYTIMFGLFLKLLGFFVVLYSYADFEPSKVQAVEHSLKQRFNITLPTQMMQSKGGQDLMSASVLQNLGRSYNEIEKDLKTQIDFLSTRRNARTGTMMVSIPADIILSLDGKPAKSPQFTQFLVNTLKNNRPPGFRYSIDITAKGAEQNVLMRGVGDFVQNIIAQDYNAQLLTISFDDKTLSPKPVIDLEITAVPQ